MAKKDDNLKKILKKFSGLVAGPNAEKLVELLYKKKNVNEKWIAGKMGGSVNEVRNLLYQLAAHNIMSFSRKKDKRRGGWYIYFWTIEERKSLESYKERLFAELKRTDDNISRKKSETHYHCENCYLEFNEEGALLRDYTCPECGEVLQMKDVSRDIAKLERAREQLKDEIEIVERELEKMETKRQREVEKREEEIRRQKEEERRKRRLKAKRKAAREARGRQKAKKQAQKPKRQSAGASRAITRKKEKAQKKGKQKKTSRVPAKKALARAGRQEGKLLRKKSVSKTRKTAARKKASGRMTRTLHKLGRIIKRKTRKK